MVLRKAGRLADQLQRVQAVWAAVPSPARVWITSVLVGTGTAAGGALAARASNMNAAQAYVTIIGCGGIGLAAYRAWRAAGAVIPPVRPEDVAAQLTRFRQQAIDNVLAKPVETKSDQDAMDAYENGWLRRVVAYMKKSNCAPSDISKVSRITPYGPIGMNPLVKDFDPNDPEKVKLARRNARLRNEMAERLNRLMQAIERIEAHIKP